ncbi:MAG: class I SAM-dependent methyltransferase [Desulfobacterales bacterium]|nr:class I SAM-dependent methyltransferase [Desulfobacterales bacterium]
MKSDDSITAKIYDPLLYFFIKPIRMAVLNELSGYKNKAILDLCCGTGNQMRLLAKHGFTNLHCLDLSPAMLDIARRSDYQINIYNEDATQTHFGNESFDIVTTSFAIHEKDKTTQQNLMNETHRLLRKNGLLLAVDFVFDEQTPKISKIGISFVESLAGGDHYKNFKAYIHNNCLAGVIKPDRFTPLKSDRKPYKSVSLSLYRKK